MAYETVYRRNELNISQDDRLASKRFTLERQPEIPLFYELEEAVVLDVIMDENHPEVKDSSAIPEEWPKNIDGTEPTTAEKDYGNIGKIKFRFLNSQRGIDKVNLYWAYPIENTGIVEYPLMNEVVIVGRYLGKYFYSKKLNVKSLQNSNSSFLYEKIAGRIRENVNEYTGKPQEGKSSVLDSKGKPDYTGVIGSYFKFNSNIRTLKKFEGDTVLESRFGSSIRFGSYDNFRDNDNGIGEYRDGGGNPMVLIRNRQAPIKHPQGKTAKGYTLEDINRDGSSIHITSGKTVSAFQTTVSTPIMSGRTPVGIPILKGDQIIINSDRLVFSSKANQMLFFSKGRMAMVTDQPYSITSAKMITFTAATTATISAPQIFLGDYGKTYQPAVLGRSMCVWLYALVDWLLYSVNSQIQFVLMVTAHFHAGGIFAGVTGPTIPPVLPLYAEQIQSLLASKVSLLALRSQISSLMSSRVYVSGGPDDQSLV